MTEEFDTANSLLDPLPGEKVPYDKREAICDELPLGVPTSAVVPDAALELETILDDIHVNGGAHLGAVRVLPDERFDWALSRGSSRLLRRRVLSSAALAETLPELELSADRKHEAFDDIEWEHYPSYTLDGYLTENLVAGGAYYSFLEPPFQDIDETVPGYEHVPESYGDRKDAKRLAERFVEAVFGERYGEFTVAFTDEGWCDWFQNISVWNRTYFCFDRRTRLVWVLAVTGSD
ncbi:hypothetical protein [Haloarcula rara]|uniref:hypothetical protein n=1 Tax=Haloarcula rara TaxID=3033387 RepID=UPI0023E8DFE5|nr:hypothetical protein [Halomicroarcula sp. SHR3]